MFTNSQQNSDSQPQSAQESESNSEAYVSQTLVIGVFLLIFLAQVGVNFLQVLRDARRRRAIEAEMRRPLRADRENQRINGNDNENQIGEREAEGDG